MKSLKDLTGGQKFFLYSTYIAVLVSFLGGFLTIGLDLAIGKILIGVSVPVIFVSGIAALLLFNLTGASSQDDKRQ